MTMKSKRKQQTDKGAFEIIEEVFHLLRMVPAGTIASYYVGSLPFILGLLYFWTDMSKGAFAYAHLPGGAVIMSLLFIWMKAWQSVYAQRLMSDLCGETSSSLSMRSFIRIAMRQTLIHVIGLFLLPITLIITLPFGYAYAFCQNMTVLEDGKAGNLRELERRAATQAKLWPKQNFLLIWALSPYLLVTAVTFYLVLIPIIKVWTPVWTSMFLTFYSVFYMFLVMPLSPFGVAIAANIGYAILILPQLLKILFGIETVFVQSPMSMLTSTFFAVICGLTYLCMDPLMKAAYVLRCFYGESLRTGRDLKVELKRIINKVAVILIISVMVTGIAIPGNVSAQEDGALVVSADDLGQALERELGDARYSWRMPRIHEQGEEGVVGAFMRGVRETLMKWAKTAWRWTKKVLDWFGDRFVPDAGGDRSMFSAGSTLRPLLYALIGLLTALVAIALWRMWRRRDQFSIEVAAEAVDSVPDLEDETTTADQLPEDGWITMARELIANGNFRLALRAVFLASLAYLSQSELIRISLFKTNLDYQHELQRRVHVQPEILDLFSQNVRIFESVWYGTHEASKELLEDVMANSDRMRIHGQ